jgi:D-aminoacyl-tRNA deacylase
MRAVVQRVSRASVTVEGRVVGAIDEPGLLVLVGVTHDDSPAHAERLAAKLWNIRILDGGSGSHDGTGSEPEGRSGSGPEGRSGSGSKAGSGAGSAGNGREVSCADLGAPLLVISQFTLYGDTRKGRRPSWSAAAPGPVAEPLVDHVVASLRGLGARVETGRFGAQMDVSLINDGPITLVIEVA